VTLNVRPTLTRQTGTVTSPETGYIQSLINSSTPSGTTPIVVPAITVPVIEVRELDSVMKVKSGDVMVIGGLMQDETRNTDSGAPGLDEIPVLGNLFKSRSEDSSKTELIVFIKATIVNTDGSANTIDRAVYEKYVTDPRPLFPKQ
jgi:MSHA biogenesis protein MshL